MTIKLGLGLCLAVTALAGAAQASPNLVTNGDFSAGATGFSTGYTYAAPSPSALYPEGVYTVASNPNDVHPSWVTLPEGDNKLIVNGATASTPTIWEELNLATVAGGSYVFSASAANICCNASFSGANDPSHLLFQISSNGGASYSDLTELYTHPPGDAGQFQTVSAAFTATGSTSFRIVDALSGQSGNDFAVDNISVVSSAPEPGVWALMMGGVGLLGAMLRLTGARRREDGLLARAAL